MYLLFRYVNEWAVPADKAAEALVALRAMIKREKLYVHFPIEIRWTKGEDIMLSPSYGRETCYIGMS